MNCCVFARRQSGVWCSESNEVDSRWNSACDVVGARWILCLECLRIAALAFHWDRYRVSGGISSYPIPYKCFCTVCFSDSFSVNEQSIVVIVTSNTEIERG